MGVTSICIVSSIDMTSQSITFAKVPHVCIATPGRFVERLQLQTKHAKNRIEMKTHSAIAIKQHHHNNRKKLIS